MSTDLAERVRSLERALTERDDPPAPLPTIADVSADVTKLDDRVASLKSSVTELDARQQAVEAYVDQVEHVDATIERRADAALAAVDRLESTLRDEPHPTLASASGATAEGGVGQNAPSATQPHPVHVTDASRTTDDSNEREESTRSGLLARILGV